MLIIKNYLSNISSGGAVADYDMKVDMKGITLSMFEKTPYKSFKVPPKQTYLIEEVKVIKSIT